MNDAIRHTVLVVCFGEAQCSDTAIPLQGACFLMGVPAMPTNKVNGSSSLAKR